ncbi:actin maturation protease [Amyelois transitella]|uniref:actin maturation protease n=1 Tax=Amyelois transitella TaxID=680683 RepID=UPI00298F993E|nr:actin maturation protease [Amyelois transitella]
MCTIPPVPPPPPPESKPSLISPTKCAPDQDIAKRNFDVCHWALDHELSQACEKYHVCLNEAPFKYKYKHFESRIQVGPTCGLVALSMLCNDEITPEELLSIAKMEGYSNNGEMFSCENMIKLTEKVFNLTEINNVKYELRRGGLFSKETIEKLLDGAVLLVPYDADFNHSPCLKKGHTAHWALVCGVIIINDPGEAYEDPENVYVLCKHGKSRYLAAWKLAALDASNKNLMEFSPKRGGEEWIYILPEGGIGGDRGLRDQFLLYEGV